MSDEYVVFANGNPTTRHIYDPEKDDSLCGQIRPRRNLDGEIHGKNVIVTANKIDEIREDVENIRNICETCVRVVESREVDGQ